MKSDPNFGHSDGCACIQPGDRECNCHLAYGFPTAEAMGEADTDERRTLAASKADSAKGDWVLVPRSATPAMIDAGRSCLGPVFKGWIASAWAAMIAATPTPQPEGGRGEAVREARAAIVDALRTAYYAGKGPIFYDCATPNWQLLDKLTAYINLNATPTDAARVRDAERLDWLEANGESINLTSRVVNGYREYRDPIGTSRAAIDAALAAVEGDTP